MEILYLFIARDDGRWGVGGIIDKDRKYYETIKNCSYVKLL